MSLRWHFQFPLPLAAVSLAIEFADLQLIEHVAVPVSGVPQSFNIIISIKPKKLVILPIEAMNTH